MNISESLSEICRVKINFSSYDQQVVASENSPHYDYVGFKVDRRQGVMMLLSKFLGEGSSERLYLKVIVLNDN